MKKTLLALALLAVGAMTAPSCGTGIYHGYGGYGGGVGGGKPCSTCGDYLADGQGDLCAGDDELNYGEVVNCLCNGPCADACAGDLFCDPAGEALSDCDACLRQDSGCAAEYATCTGPVVVCSTCSQYLTDPTGVLCPGSDMLYDEMLNCLCNGPCAEACKHDSYCDPNGAPDSNCDACQQDASGCGPEYTDCAGDM